MDDAVRVSREVLAREALDEETRAYLDRFARGDLGTDGDRT
jgi:hypothetical protein